MGVGKTEGQMIEQGGDVASDHLALVSPTTTDFHLVEMTGWVSEDKSRMGDVLRSVALGRLVCVWKVLFEGVGAGKSPEARKATEGSPYVVLRFNY